MAHLKVLEGVHRGKVFTFTNEVLLGRSQDNEVSLPDSRISRQHARISRQGDGFAIEDLYSTNGVILRGKRIPSGTLCALRDGDELEICTNRLVFYAEALPVEAGQPDNAAPRQRRAEGQGGQPLPGKATPPTLSLAMLPEGVAQPSVAVALDARASMVAVEGVETHADKGLQEALRRLQAMCQVSLALGVVTDRDPLMQKIMDCLFEIFPAAERAFVLLYEKDGDELIPVAIKRRQDVPTQQEEIAISRVIVQEVITQKHALLSFDAMEDQRFRDHSSIINLSIRSMMCAPLLVGTQILGLIHVDSQTGPRLFTSEDLQVLTGIAAQAAIAIKNMQLYEAIEAETSRRTSLQRYFSPGVVEMLMSGNLTTTLGGKIYHGTVMFCDIIGFTGMNETMSPTEVVTNLNYYFGIMQKVIYDHAGNVDKISGDGLMAFWGVPQHGAHDACDAVLAALHMQRQLWPFNLALAAEGKAPMYMGIGLSSGEFVAGNIGSQDKIEFTLIGDTVNLAARLEGLAGRYQILVNEATWEAVRPLVSAVQLPPVLLKGKTRPVTVYSIRTMLDDTQGEWVMALPCDILDVQEQHVGRGMLTGVSNIDTAPHLQLSTAMRLAPGDHFTLCLDIVEYQEPCRIAVMVESCSRAGQQHNSTYTRAVLTVLSGPDSLVCLTPGTCLVTAYPWERLERI
jgi:adenylate cyclase